MNRSGCFTRNNVLRRTISQLAMLMLKIAGADAKGEASEFYKNKFDDMYLHTTLVPR